MANPDDILQTTIKSTHLPAQWWRLFAAYSVSSAGDQISAVALFALVYELGGDLAGLSTIAIVQITPIVLFGPLGGRFAALGWGRNHLVIVSLARAIILVIVALVGNLFVIYFCVAIHAALGAVFRPVEAVYEVTLVGDHQLVKINSYRVIARQTSWILMPAAAGLALTVIDAAPLLIVDAASFVAAALILLTIRVQDRRHSDAESHSENALNHLKTIGFTQKVVLIFASVIVLNLVLGMQGPLFFGYFNSLFEQGALVFGLVLSAMAVGSIGTSALLARGIGGKALGLRLLYVIMLFDGMALLALTMTGNVALMCAVSLVLGAISAVYMITVRTMLQGWPVAEKRAPLLGAFETLSGAAHLGSLVTAALVAHLITEKGLLQIGAVVEIAVASLSIAAFMLFSGVLRGPGGGGADRGLTGMNTSRPSGSGSTSPRKPPTPS